MSNQFNIMQGILVSVGVISYYLVTYLISIILQNDIKNVLPHQMSTGLYWILVILLLFRLYYHVLLSRDINLQNLPFST